MSDAPPAWQRWLDALTPVRLLLIGGALRLVWLLACRNEPYSDQGLYHQAASAIAAGKGFVDTYGEPHGWWPVGYPAALSPFYILFGPGPVAAHIANFVFGILLVGGVYAFAREMFGERSARLAGLLAAVSPTFVMLTTVHASEVLFVVLAVWGSWALARAVHQPERDVPYCALGALIVGLSAYVRAPGLLMAAVYPVLALFSRVKFVRLLALSVMIGAIAIAVLIPWGFRTQREFGTFQIVSMNGGSNLWMGNNPDTDGGYMPLPDWARGRHLPEREKDLRDRAVAFITEDPVRYVKLCVRRTLMTLRSDTISTVWNERGMAKWGAPALVTSLFKLVTSGFFYAVWLALFATLFARRKQWSRYDLVMLGTVIASGFTFVVIVGGNRYHLPLAPYLWVWLSSAALLLTSTRSEGASPVAP